MGCPYQPISSEKEINIATVQTSPENNTELSAQNSQGQAKLDLVDQRISEISGLIQSLESEESSHEQQESIEFLEDELAMAQEEREDLLSQYGLY